jgi:membrane protein
VTVARLKERAGGFVDDVVTTARRRVPFLTHLLAMVKHFGDRDGSVLAGGVTYFGFLSFFPILALTFAGVGVLSTYYGGVEGWVRAALDSTLPGLVGSRPGQIRLGSLAHTGAAVGLVGALGLLYSGLGWLSALRSALQAMFDVPAGRKRSFVVAKLVDVVALAGIGVTLVLSVAVTGVAAGFSRDILDWLGLSSNAWTRFALWVLTVGIGLTTSTMLFLLVFRLLGRPQLTTRALVGGALLAAIGFEVMKVLASFLIANASSSPAAAIVGVSLVLLVWINYFARVTLYGAAWAATGPSARSRVPAPVPVPTVVPSPRAIDTGRQPTAAVDRGRIPGLADETRDAVSVNERVAFATGALVGVAVGVLAGGVNARRRDD